MSATGAESRSGARHTAAPDLHPPARGFGGARPAEQLALDWRGAVRALAYTAICLLVLSLGAKLLQAVHIERYSWIVSQIVPHFDVDVERSVPTWFSALLLFLAASQLLLVGHLRRRGDGALARYWTGLGAIFMLLSVDEIGSFHNIPLVSEEAARGVSDFLAISWVIHGMAAVAAVGVVFVPFLRALPRTTALDLVRAGAVYVGGALGMEMIGARFIFAIGFEHPIVSVILTIEEGMEMFGVLLLLTALFRYIEREFPRVCVTLTPHASNGR